VENSPALGIVGLRLWITRHSIRAADILRVVKIINALRQAFRRHRRILAAAAAALAVLAALSAVRGEGEGQVVLVAARSLPGGTVLTDADLATAVFPEALLPEGSLADPAQASGQTVAGPLSKGAVVTSGSFLTSATLVAEGMVAAPLSFGESAPLELLSPGAKIDIFGPDPATGKSKALASGVRVIALPEAKADVLGSGAQTVLVEVTPSVAATLASATGISSLTFALR
jgi:Flp pilus assembly protein CpaB